jgi:excisionase family DNA binding protein
LTTDEKSLTREARPGTLARGRQARMSDDIWLPPQLAAYLGLATNTVYTLLAQGVIPGQVRLGRRWRISKIAFLRSVHGEPQLPEGTGGGG